MGKSMKKLVGKSFIVICYILILVMLAGFIAKWFFSFSIETMELLAFATPLIAYLVYMAKGAYKKLKK
jgi:hypothetical protein